MAPLTMDTLPARPVAPAQPTQLQADVILAGEHQVTRGDPLALPGGSRFAVQVRSSRAGVLEVLALAADGRAPVRLWQQQAGARTTLRSLTLRLEGAPGVERLRVVLRSDQGQLLAERELRIWHR